jgi:hypothetical protein
MKMPPLRSFAHLAEIRDLSKGIYILQASNRHGGSPDPVLCN